MFLCVLLAAACAFAFTLLGIEYYPLLQRRVKPQKFPWTRFSPAVREAMTARCRALLESPDPLLRHHRHRLRLFDWLQERRRARKSLMGHGRALVALGMTTAQKNFPDPRNLAALNRFWTEILQENGNLRSPVTSVEHCLMAWPLLDMHELTGNALHLKAAGQIVDAALAGLPRAGSGVFVWTKDAPGTVLVDTLAMISPVLIRYGRLTAREDVVKVGIYQLEQYLQRGINRETGLPYHAYEDRSGEAMGLVAWSRGSAWLAMGLADSIISLPAGHPARESLQQAFLDLYGRVKRGQRQDGSWSWVMNVDGARSDYSATAILNYSAQRLASAGIIDGDFTAMIEQAVHGIARNTTSEGSLVSGLADCDWIGAHPLEFGNTAHAQGPATALLAMYERGRQTA